MRLLDDQGRIVADGWRSVADDEALPACGAVIVSAARLAVQPTPEAMELGVALDAGAALDPILAWLRRLSLVAVPFPVFRDGRGFTAARALRERHGFVGEIRATGHPLPDQYAALLRVGVSTVELPDDADIAAWQEALRLSGQLEPRPQRLPWIRRAALPFRPDLARFW